MAHLDDRYVAKAKELVFDKFPEMDGVKPSVSVKRSQSKNLLARELCFNSSTGSAVGAGRSSEGCAQYVVTFERDVPLPGGAMMRRLVRVTMDEAGDVLRLTSSK
ncbi:MAG: hypothetical protein PVI07_15735 [Anaerolineae bacterium]|jgi:hypothetical protein